MDITPIPYCYSHHKDGDKQVKVSLVIMKRELLQFNAESAQL